MADKNYLYGRGYRWYWFGTHGLLVLLLVPFVVFEVWRWRSGRPQTINLAHGFSINTRLVGSTIGGVGLATGLSLVFWHMSRLKRKAQALRGRNCPACFEPTIDGGFPKVGESCPRCKHLYRKADLMNYAKQWDVKELAEA
nr:hypothetical protein [Phycisphaerales bacterium]